MVELVTTSRFHTEVLESETPVVVDFYADWCGPCNALAPIVERLSDEWEGEVRFVRVDTQAEPRLAHAYNISSIPALLLFEDGEVGGWSTGVKPGYLIEKELGLKKLRKAGAPRNAGRATLSKWLADWRKNGLVRRGGHGSDERGEGA